MNVATDAPRLTVLLTAWSAATTVARAIDSVLQETSVALELVVVDDGSSDTTPEVVAEVAARDPRVVVERLPANVGVSEARNRGLELARGTWITFLDADDRFLPGGIAALMRPTAEPDVLAVVGQRIWSDGERTWLSPVYDIPDIREPGRKSIATHPGLTYYASVTGKAFHRSLIGGLRFEGRVLGDQPWAIRALLRAGDRIEVVADTVFEWSRPHPDRYVPTITAESRSSATKAAVAAAMARPNFLAVSAEVDATIADPAARRAVTRTYADRLIRSDLGGQVKAAVDRSDPAAGRLFATIGTFLDAVPPSILAASEFLVSRILRPPTKRWRALGRRARMGYWRMLRPAVRADPRIARAAYPDGHRAFRVACRALRLLPAPVAPLAAEAIVTVASGVRTVRRRLRGAPGG